MAEDDDLTDLDPEEVVTFERKFASLRTAVREIMRQPGREAARVRRVPRSGIETFDFRDGGHREDCAASGLQGAAVELEAARGLAN